MVKQSILLVTLFLTATLAQAQLTDMHWDTHGVGFKVPSDLRITTNTAEEFTAEGNNLILTIAPIQDGALSDDNMADATLAMAQEIGYDSVSDGDAVSIDDFKGYYLRGKKDGATAIVMALMDQKSSTNLLVIVAYNDGFENKALEVANSFYAYD